MKKTCPLLFDVSGWMAGSVNAVHEHIRTCPKTFSMMDGSLEGMTSYQLSFFILHEKALPLNSVPNNVIGNQVLGKGRSTGIPDPVGFLLPNP